MQCMPEGRELGSLFVTQLCRHPVLLTILLIDNRLQKVTNIHSHSPKHTSSLRWESKKATDSPSVALHYICASCPDPGWFLMSDNWGVYLLAIPETGAAACDLSLGDGLALLRSSTTHGEKEESSCAAADLSYCSSWCGAGSLASLWAPVSSHDGGGWSAPWPPLDRNCSCCCCSCPSQPGVRVTYPVWSAGACHCSRLSSASEDGSLAACPRAPDCSWNENPHWKARATSGFPSCPPLQSPRVWGHGQLSVAVRSCCSHGWKRCDQWEEVAWSQSSGRTASWAAHPAAGGKVAGAVTC